jgi:hypothetical protein
MKFDLDTVFSIGGILVALPFMLYLGYRMSRVEKDVDDRFLVYVLLVLTISMFMNIGPQYVIVVLPFLIMQICCADRSYMICWVLVGCGAALSALVLNNYSLMMGTSVFWDWPSYTSILDGFDWTEAYIFGTNSFRSLMNSVGYAFMGAGLILTIVFHYQEVIVGKCPKVGPYLDRIRGFSFRRGSVE